MRQTKISQDVKQSLVLVLRPSALWLGCSHLFFHLQSGCYLGGLISLGIEAVKDYMFRLSIWCPLVSIDTVFDWP
jgi:hypothetical protein